jgi:hypothetical protein
MNLKWKHIKNGHPLESYVETVRKVIIGDQANYIVRRKTSDLLYEDILRNIRSPTVVYCRDLMRRGA